jgi:hypothetical protein
MPADKEARPLASPWKEFLTELDGMLDEPLELHCIGGFVFTYFYGLSRTTGDIDYYTAIPVNLNLDKVAGQGSHLHTKHGVWLHRVAVANLPEDCATRLTDMADLGPVDRDLRISRVKLPRNLGPLPCQGSGQRAPAMACKTVAQDAPRQTLYMPLADPSGKNRWVALFNG